MPIDPITGMAIANVATGVIGGVSELLRSGRSNRDARRSRADYERQMGAIPLEDPDMVNYLGDTRRRRRAFEAGTDPLTSYASEQIREQGQMTQTNALRAGARGVGDLLRVQAGTDAALGNVAARASANANNLFALEGSLVGAMADRTYRRQMADARLAWNEYARAKEDSGRQFQAGLGMILGAGAEAAGGMGGMKSAATPTAGIPDTGADNPFTGTSNYMNNIGYRSRRNYGFNYLPPSPNYGLI